MFPLLSLYSGFFFSSDLLFGNDAVLKMENIWMLFTVLLQDLDTGLEY